MLEVNKSSFYSEQWRRVPIRSQHEILTYSSASPDYQSQGTHSTSEINPEMSLGLDFKLIADGRILFNYYDFDYNGILYAVNSSMMGMLIRMQFEGGYHIYVFR